MAPRRSAFTIVGDNRPRVNRGTTYRPFARPYSNGRMQFYQRAPFLHSAGFPSGSVARVERYQRNSAARLIQSKFRRTRPTYRRPVRRMANPYTRRTRR